MLLPGTDVRVDIWSKDQRCRLQGVMQEQSEVSATKEGRNLRVRRMRTESLSEKFVRLQTAGAVKAIRQTQEIR